MPNEEERYVFLLPNWHNKMFPIFYLFYSFLFIVTYYQSYKLVMFIRKLTTLCHSV